MAERATLYYVEMENVDGFPVETLKKTTVFCREKSATRMEFYEALRSGISISIVLEVRQEDYNLTAHKSDDGRKQYAQKVEFDGAQYDIVRTYRNDKSMMELICV